MKAQDPLQRLVPIIGVTIGVALGVLVSLIIDDSKIVARILGREMEEVEQGQEPPST